VPLWLYIVVLGTIQLIVSPAIALALFAGATRVWRPQSPINKRSAPAAIAIVYAQIIVSLGLIWTDNKVVGALGSLLFFVSLLFMVRRLTQARWGRSVVIVATYFAASIAAYYPLAIVLKGSIAETYRIPTAPMAPAIQPGDRIVVDRTLTPQRWDIVVYHRPWEDQVSYVGRLVGVPGEQVEIAPPGLKINGKPIQLGPEMNRVAYVCRPYSGQPSQQAMICNGCGTPITLGPDEYFFLGDNSAQALDSRYWDATPTHQAGALPRDRIVGVVRLRYGPFDRVHVFR
jgi:signal peptidase I